MSSRGKEPAFPDKIVAIDAALAKAKVPSAFGGALALAYYAEPRATIDIDVNVFVSPAEAERVRDALEPLGIKGWDELDKTLEEGQGRVFWGRNPVDIFFSYDEIHDAMREQVRRVPFGEDRIPILSPEHLIVCKVAFDRAKDWIDIEQTLTMIDHLDLDEITSQLSRLLPESDPRLGRLLELVGALRG